MGAILCLISLPLVSFARKRDQPNLGKSFPEKTRSLEEASDMQRIEYSGCCVRPSHFPFRTEDSFSSSQEVSHSLPTAESLFRNRSPLEGSCFVQGYTPSMEAAHIHRLVDVRRPNTRTSALDRIILKGHSTSRAPCRNGWGLSCNWITVLFPLLVLLPIPAPVVFLNALPSEPSAYKSQSVSQVTQPVMASKRNFSMCLEEAFGSIPLLVTSVLHGYEWLIPSS